MNESKVNSDSAVWNVPGFGVHHLAKLLENRGSDVASLLKSANLPAYALETPPGFVDVRNELRLLELSIEATRDPMFAISAGKTFNPRQTRLLGYVVSNSPKVGPPILGVAALAPKGLHPS